MSPQPPLREAYSLLRTAHGHQHWWPAQSPFEVCVGAILTQNTSWKNVEAALARLVAANALEPLALHELPLERLTELLRPAGCPTVKARRLRAFLAVLVEECHGSLARLMAGDTASVRRRLLAIPGIGPETADCLLLYAGGHPSFVVDAYTRRVFERHGWVHPRSTYDELQHRCATALPSEDPADALDLWQDFHAQIVAVGKTHCRPRHPRCDGCPLRSLLPASGPHAAPAPSLRRPAPTTEDAPP